MSKKVKKEKTREELYKQTLKFFDMTAEEYSFYFFDLGIKYIKKFHPENIELLKNRAFWRIFEYEMMQDIEFRFEQDISKGLCLCKSKENYDWFENWVYSNAICNVELINSLKSLLKAQKTPTRPRTTNSKNNQLEKNLNTI